MFVEWLIEVYYLDKQAYIQLSHIPHYTTLQKFAATVSKRYCIGKDNFLVYIVTSISEGYSSVYIDSSGFKVSIQCFTILYYTDKVNLHKKKYLKLSTGVEVLSQIDSIFYQDKERAPTRHDTIDFQPIVERTSEILPPIVSSCCC